jgi:hypothetical protein
MLVTLKNLESNARPMLRVSGYFLTAKFTALHHVSFTLF